MLTCKQLTELVTDYLEGRMPLMRRMSFQFHLGMCRHCRAYLRQMKMTLRTLGVLPREYEIPAPVRDELLVRFRDVFPARCEQTQTVETKRLGTSVFARLAAGLSGAGGWTFAGGILLLAFILPLALDGTAGTAFEGWTRCLFMELVAAALPVTGVALLAMRSRERLSAGAFAAVAAGGAFAGNLLLLWKCDAAVVTTHLLLIHAGGIALAALLGAAASRLPPLRRAGL